nr:hypothetical protein [uncultured bacterium]
MIPGCTLFQNIIIKNYRTLIKLGRNLKLFLVSCFTTMENRIYDNLSLSLEERYRKKELNF